MKPLNILGIASNNLPLKMFSRFLLAVVGFMAIAGCSRANQLEMKKNIPLTSTEEILAEETVLKLTPTSKKNAVGNPIYQLDLFVNGKRIKSYETLTGRHDTQQKDRHVSGTEAPLPNGKYLVFHNIVPGTHPEVGGRFLPIEPLFTTGRSALGFHYDPSYEKTNGEDGTAGCIAFTNREQLDNFLTDLNMHKFQSLIVDIQ